MDAAVPALNVVVVEDHDMLRLMIRQALREAGHRVVALSCAEQLADEARGFPADVFLIDLNLPGEDGLSLIRRLRETSPLAGVIVVTARSAIDDRLDAYSSGADLFLAKPLDVRELCAAIAAFARRRQRVDKVLARQDLTLGLREMTLTQAGCEPVSLTPAEAALLATLARAPGQRVASWQLAETLGLDLREYAKSNLEVRMVRLRKKLIAAGAPASCLESIRGFGYQLCVNLQVV